MKNNVFLNGVSRNDLAFALGFSCHGYKNRTDQAEDMRAARERVRKALDAPADQTIDGVLVSCELLKVALGYPNNGDEMLAKIKAREELRALLDADKVNNRQMGLMQFVDAHPTKPAAQPQGEIETLRAALRTEVDAGDSWKRKALELREKLESQPQGEPVALQHMAVSEGGVLRWMTGRKMQDCELYAMPDGSAIRSNLYAEQPAPVAMDGLMAFMEDMEKPRPIRFADLPVVNSLDELSVGHQIELLRDALDHIAKTCHQSRQSTRRIRWIEARANGALEGKPYDAKLIELPVKVDREIDRMKRRDSQQVARIWEFEALLLQSNELLYAIQGDPGAVPSSSIDAMRGKVFTALNGVPATCTWSSAEFSWSSTCGMAGWEFTDSGTPAENGMKFCHCCGKPITVAVPKDEA